QLAGRPHSVLPVQAVAEADQPSQLFQYYLLDTTGFEPNVFTTSIPGVNDAVQLSVTGANCGLPTIGTVRVVLEPKPGLPTDPNDPNAFIDVFTDIDPLFVINNESGREHTTRFRRSTCMPTGSSTTSERTGSILSMNSPSRVASPMPSVSPLTRSRTARSACYSRSCPARDRAASTTWLRCSATIRTCPETPTSSMATSMPSGSSGSGVYPAAWPTKSFWMSMSDRLRLNQP